MMHFTVCVVDCKLSRLFVSDIRDDGTFAVQTILLTVIACWCYQVLLSQLHIGSRSCSFFVTIDPVSWLDDVK